MLTLFTLLISLQFVIILTHDLVDIPGLVHGSQVQRILGRRKVWLATIVNSILPGIAVGFALAFWNKPVPGYASNYWIIYCAIAMASAVAMWYLPYFRGAPEQHKLEYLRMYEGTIHILPQRDNNPRPNLFHVGIHVLFAVNLCLAAMLRLTSA